LISLLSREGAKSEFEVDVVREIGGCFSFLDLGDSSTAEEECIVDSEKSINTNFSVPDSENCTIPSPGLAHACASAVSYEIQKLKLAVLYKHPHPEMFKVGIVQTPI